MKKIEIKLGRHVISRDSACFVIAEIGHNHQGNLKVAMDMIKSAAECGVNAVKFQKRDNRSLYTEAMYSKPYDNESSFGLTYGEHREFLEFDKDEYITLKKCAEDNKVEFMCTAFDLASVDFLEGMGISSYKIASGDVANTPLLEKIARLGKPVFLSTGASTIDEVRLAYKTIIRHNDRLCLMHTTCVYPADYSELNLRVIESMAREFPKAIIGYSGHDNGILAGSIAYLLGARVLEKHFTINRAWKGTDHKFSLEPAGLRKQVRDLRRIDMALGDGKKTTLASEIDARTKMGKSIYARTALAKEHVLCPEDIVIKSPGGGLQPYHLDKVIGKRLKTDLPEESFILFEALE